MILLFYVVVFIYWKTTVRCRKSEEFQNAVCQIPLLQSLFCWNGEISTPCSLLRNCVPCLRLESVHTLERILSSHSLNWLEVLLSEAEVSPGPCLHFHLPFQLHCSAYIRLKNKLHCFFFSGNGPGNKIGILQSWAIMTLHAKKSRAITSEKRSPLALPFCRCSLSTNLSLNHTIMYLAVHCCSEKMQRIHMFLCSSFVVETTFFFLEGMLWVLIFCSQSEPIYPLKNESRTKQSAFFLPYWIQLKKDL